MSTLGDSRDLSTWTERTPNDDEIHGAQPRGRRPARAGRPAGRLLFIVAPVTFAMLVNCGRKSATDDVPPRGSSAPATIASAPAKPPSAFDALWEGAEQRDSAESFNAALTAFLTKAAYCKKHNCGDEFEPDGRYKAALAEGKKIIATTWRLRIDNDTSLTERTRPFHPGTFDAEKLALPLVAEWPIKAHYSTFTIGEGRGGRSRPETLFTLNFQDGAQARKWKADHKALSWRIVFNVVGGVTDSYGDGLVLIKILGQQIRTRDEIVFESLSTKDAGSAPTVTPPGEKPK